jgi:hypothetical protein
MNVGCLNDRCPNEYLLPTLEGYLLITQNVHTNATAELKGSVVFCMAGE